MVGASKYFKKQRRKENLSTDMLKFCFYSVESLTTIMMSVLSVQEPHFIVLAFLRLGRNKRTKISLAGRILGNFFSLPTSFVGTRKRSIWQRFMLIKEPHLSSTTDAQVGQHSIKLSHCYNNLYQMMEVKSLYQKTHNKLVNGEIFTPPLCLTVSPTTFLFLQFLGIFYDKIPTS